MALVEEAKLESPCFDEAIRQVCYFFQVDRLYQDQLNAVKAFLKGNNVFLCANTGFGKSIVFQCIPLIIDILSEQAI
jgi:superfamily II DNA helicase RecQ